MGEKGRGRLVLRCADKEAKPEKCEQHAYMCASEKQASDNKLTLAR